jgi:hypothetical protein
MERPSGIFCLCTTLEEKMKMIVTETEFLGRSTRRQFRMKM